MNDITITMFTEIVMVFPHIRMACMAITTLIRRKLFIIMEGKTT